jgi:hypothetical protein
LARLSENTVPVFNGRDVLSENDREPSKSNPREQTNGLTVGKFHRGSVIGKCSAVRINLFFAGICRDA